MSGTIFNIQRFSIHDGPGIRTTVFFKGCPLACRWCHNPEGLRTNIEIGFDKGHCIHCLQCRAACKRGLGAFSREGCSACGACADACPTGALRVIGRRYEAKEVIDQVLRDKPFFASNGGLTLSGGEPSLQADFAREILTLARSHGIHTCLETCGEAPLDTLKALALEADMVLYDIKELDPALHRAFTGQDNHLILNNLMSLDRAGARIVLRCPIIPGKNLRDEHFLGIAALASTLASAIKIDLIPYHPLGIHKYTQLGMHPEKLPEIFADAPALFRGAALMRERVNIPIEII